MTQSMKIVYTAFPNLTCNDKFFDQFGVLSFLMRNAIIYLFISDVTYLCN